jgi:uncharacterized Zn-binding protein involved in type VI secretion
MSGVCRAFQDTAGGLILEGIDSFLVDGMPICVEGNPIQSHGQGDHNNAIMTNGSSFFIVNGIPVCTEASQASCGHTPTGSSTFLIG